MLGGITFDNVSFIYDDGNEWVLRNVSFDIKAGETVAIMGPTGSGKSSLVHLLTRIYDATEGMISFDNHDITSLSPRYVRENVGIVLQEPYLFSKSIFDNIRVATPYASEHDVYEAARVASIHDVIAGFDQGYNTAVGEKGVTLSGGQKQRVAIARTVINKQPIVIFDDSLSALDTETDSNIRNELKRAKSTATTLIITHRVNSRQTADKIIVINNGRVEQIGTHNDLIARRGYIKRLPTFRAISLEVINNESEYEEEIFDEETPDTGLWRKILGLLAQSKKRMFIALFIVLGESAIGVTLPLLNRHAIDVFYVGQGTTQDIILFGLAYALDWLSSKRI
ncbi:ATP-binding cassette domain-containing protein [Erysipelothrix sp. D19-032]